MKVALVHDYLREYGGAERVLEVLHEIWPDAPIFTAYVNLDAMGENGKRFSPPAGGWDIRTSWLQKMPFVNKLVSPFRIFAPMMFESFDLSEYDVVISSCNVYFSKAVITKPEALHISYIHTPPRYLYGYTTSYNYKKHWWTRIGGEIINHFLRIYDFEVSQRPDILVANSRNVQQRIKKFYRRGSVVIYPPVEINRKYKVSNIKGKDYYLSVNRLVRGKGVDVIVQACDELGLSLKIVGTGPELQNLKSLIVNHKSNIEFLGQVSDEELAKLYAGAKATIVASEDEDFGIVPVESMACGTPVIAPRAGGFLETIIDQKTGEYFINATAVELMKILEGFDPKNYQAEDCRKQAERFSKERFKKEILELVNDKIYKN